MPWICSVQDRTRGLSCFCGTRYWKCKVGVGLCDKLCKWGSAYHQTHVNRICSSCVNWFSPRGEVYSYLLWV